MVNIDPPKKKHVNYCPHCGVKVKDTNKDTICSACLNSYGSNLINPPF